MKATVFFYDSEDICTGIFFSLADALSEDFVRAVGNEILPYDECSIIVWYSNNWDAHAIAEEIEHRTNQTFMPYELYHDMCLNIYSNDPTLPEVQFDP